MLPLIIAMIALSWAQSAFAQVAGASTVPPDLAGVYQIVGDPTTLQPVRKNQGSPEEIALLPAAAQRAKTVNLREDPWKKCEPIGPFRMMARAETKIEIVPAKGMIVMLFEDLSHGLMRTIHLNRGHPEKPEETWMGDSIGRWEGDTLVIDSAGFNDRTWLNDHGAQHSEALHLVERLRPVLSGKYLEYKMRAEDPKVLARPYTYTRYYEKLKSEIMDDVCEDER